MRARQQQPCERRALLRWGRVGAGSGLVTGSVGPSQVLHTCELPWGRGVVLGLPWAALTLGLPEEPQGFSAEELTFVLTFTALFQVSDQDCQNESAEANPQ